MDKLIRGVQLKMSGSKKNRNVTNKPISEMTYKITLDIPVEALSALRKNPDAFAREMLEAAPFKWYEQGKISQSKAAEIAGKSRQGFIDLLKIEPAPKSEEM